MFRENVENRSGKNDEGDVDGDRKLITRRR